MGQNEEWMLDSISLMQAYPSCFIDKEGHSLITFDNMPIFSCSVLLINCYGSIYAYIQCTYDAIFDIGDSPNL